METLLVFTSVHRFSPEEAATEVSQSSTSAAFRLGLGKELLHGILILANEIKFQIME
jgi:hypothetical protein